MSALAFPLPGLTLKPDDPAELGFPPMLPVELALRVAPVADICAAYGITREAFEVLSAHPEFIRAYQAAVEALKQDGMSFKMKAKLQAEELLQQSWNLIHDVDTPPAVKATLIKDTVRWAGYEPKGGAGAGEGGPGLAISINFINPTPAETGAPVLTIDAAE